jgi:flavorubredoxin
MNLYLPMEALLKELQVLNLQNRHVAIIANHSWASAAKKGLNQLVGAMKNITMIEPQLDIRSTLKRNQMEQLDSLAQAIADSLNSPDAP